MYLPYSIYQLREYAHQYLNWYWIVVVFFVLFTVFFSQKTNRTFNRVFPFIVCVTIVLFITFRPPVWQYFGDTPNYIEDFKWAQQRDFNPEAKDIGYEWLMHFVGPWGYELFFAIFASIYVFSHYYAAKRLFPEYVSVMLVLMISYSGFFGYGFNGMRNGAACALCLLAFTYKKLIWQIPLFLIACSFHKAALLPIGAFVIARYYKNTNVYLLIWGVCAFLNATIGNMLGDLGWLSDLINDNRVDYLEQDFENHRQADLFSKTGFRWDFLVFGAIPIYFGWQTLLNKKIVNKEYSLLFNIYLICNTAWLFTARIPYNNRFAYLSWFMMPVLVFYAFYLQPKWQTNTSINLLLLANLAVTFIL